MEESNPVTEAERGAPAVPAPPIESRFLFVDVAALRAKQLRRGARARLADSERVPNKPERIAMEEVERGLVSYDVPGGRDAAQATSGGRG